MGSALADLTDRLRRLSRRRVHARPTRAGLVFGIMLVGVVVAAINTGNNLLYLVLGTLCSLLVLSSLLAEWNLRSVVVRRRLPAEAFAGSAAPGAFLVENRRRFGAAWALRLGDRAQMEGAPQVVARGRLVRLRPGESAEVPAQWTFPHRGAVAVVGVRVESRFPFGLVQRWRDMPSPGELVVWPTPARGPLARRAPGGGASRPDRRRMGREGDFRGLRPYAPGDPLRDLHWPTSARTGRPMVVLRDGLLADEVLVEVAEARGPQWEASLSQAAGQVQRHFGAGHAVGLRLGGATHPPRAGDPWRRRLLTALATAPRRDPRRP